MDYHQGDKVEVLFDGVWQPGTIDRHTPRGYFVEFESEESYVVNPDKAHSILRKIVNQQVVAETGSSNLKSKRSANNEIESGPQSAQQSRAFSSAKRPAVRLTEPPLDDPALKLMHADKKFRVQCTSGNPSCACRYAIAKPVERYDPFTDATLQLYCSGKDCASKLNDLIRQRNPNAREKPITATDVSAHLNGTRRLAGKGKEHADKISSFGFELRHVNDQPHNQAGPKAVVVTFDDGRTEEYSSCGSAATKHQFRHNQMSQMCNGTKRQPKGKTFRWKNQPFYICLFCKQESTVDGEEMLFCDQCGSGVCAFSCAEIADNEPVTNRGIPLGAFFCTKFCREKHGKEKEGVPGEPSGVRESVGMVCEDLDDKVTYMVRAVYYSSSLESWVFSMRNMDEHVSDNERAEEVEFSCAEIMEETAVYVLRPATTEERELCPPYPTRGEMPQSSDALAAASSGPPKPADDGPIESSDEEEPEIQGATDMGGPSADEADKADEAESEDWLTTGHVWLKARVLRREPGRRGKMKSWEAFGTITRWLPANAEGDAALFHCVHDGDGDEEDLEAHEVRAGLRAFLDAA